MIDMSLGRIVLERFLYPMEAYGLYHYLDSHGVPVSISDRSLRSAMGEIPFVEIATEIFLDDPEWEDEAQKLIARYKAGLPGIRGVAWICPTCAEEHRPEFGACWNCGTERN